MMILRSSLCLFLYPWLCWQKFKTICWVIGMESTRTTKVWFYRWFNRITKQWSPFYLKTPLYLKRHSLFNQLLVFYKKMHMTSWSCYHLTFFVSNYFYCWHNWMVKYRSFFKFLSKHLPLKAFYLPTRFRLLHATTACFFYAFLWRNEQITRLMMNVTFAHKKSAPPRILS